MPVADDLAPHLPLLRRYARALTGSQESGDAYVVATLESIVAAPDEFPPASSPKVGLYTVFHKIWSTATLAEPGQAADESAQAASAGERLAKLTPPARQALLLVATEGFEPHEAGEIMEVDAADVDVLLASAIADIERQTATSVLIIEDEPIIAMDLEAIVEGLGHQVVEIADTRNSAVAAAQAHRPGLVLADIRLADGSSGIDAVKDILESFDVPVIFITAYPERLLTGERPEPTYLITKPYNEDAVKAAVSQAVFLNTAA